MLLCVQNSMFIQLRRLLYEIECIHQFIKAFRMYLRMGWSHLSMRMLTMCSKMRGIMNKSNIKQKHSKNIWLQFQHFVLGNYYVFQKPRIHLELGICGLKKTCITIKIYTAQ